MQQDDIRFSIHGRAGLVLIDRPKALNALSYDMAVALRAQLGRWGEDDTVSHVVMAGSEPRAFCAGGDIRDLSTIWRWPESMTGSLSVSAPNTWRIWRYASFPSRWSRLPTGLSWAAVPG